MHAGPVEFRFCIEKGRETFRKRPRFYGLHTRAPIRNKGGVGLEGEGEREANNDDSKSRLPGVCTGFRVVTSR